MRIIVNDIAASSGGAKTVLNDFYQYLVDSNNQNEWIFLLSDVDLKETNYIKIIKLPEIKRSRTKKLWFDFVSGKKFMENLKPDIVFSLQNIITFGLTSPQVVYVHQPLPFQNIKKYSLLKKKERNYAIYQYLIGWIIKKSIKKANLTIVQTNWMKKSVIRHCGIAENRIVQIRPNIKFNVLKDDVNITIRNKTQFFYPTSNSIYKNNELIIEAAKKLDEKNLNYHCELTIEGEYELNKNISFVGYLPYDTVVQKYYTSCLVFPSYIETFGYPLIEARTAGTIILASDCEFSKELLAGYSNAYFFNPFDANELAELMEQVINGEIVRKENKEIEKLQENSWKYVVEEIIRIGRNSIGYEEKCGDYNK